MENRWWRPGLFRRRLGRLQVRDRDGCKYLCNADWVRDALERHGCDAVTVNPPCRIPADVDVKGPRKPRVISVGAIVYQKGHDLVMETCDSVGVKCEIYGYGTAYDSRMHTSVSDDVIDSAARSAKVVMSGAFMEDFGIAVVEAIARGCVPVVPDRYGFKETVPYAELRYETKQQAARLVREAIDGTYDDLIPKLMRHVQQYSTEQFIRAMRHHLSGNRSQDI